MNDYTAYNRLQEWLGSNRRLEAPTEEETIKALYATRAELEEALGEVDEQLRGELGAYPVEGELST